MKYIERLRFSDTDSRIVPTDVSARDAFASSISKEDLVDLKCMVCGASELDEFASVERHGLYYPSGVCTKCGHIQQIIYYQQDTIEDFYSHYYRKIYGQQQPSELYDDQLIRGSEILRFVEDEIIKNGDVLEIGCGTGGILTSFRDAGYTVLGYDTDERFLKYGRQFGLELQNKYFTKCTVKKFDFIILSHVFEHIVDVKEFLASVRNSLKDNGKLYVEVPLINNLLHGEYNWNLQCYFQNAHVHHFTPETLSQVLNTADLELVKRIGKNGFLVQKLVNTKSGKFKNYYVQNIEMLEKIEHYFRFKLILKIVRKVKRWWM